MEAKLEQEAEEPHVPLDLAFKQGETIKVTFVNMWSSFLFSGLQQGFCFVEYYEQVNINILSKKKNKNKDKR